MATPQLRTRSTHAFRPIDRTQLTDPAYQAFLLLRTAFTVAPILFGLDKFANLMTFWPKYLAHWIDAIVPGSAQQDMYVVGVIEVIAGLAVLVAPRFGAWLVAGWLAGIIVNLLSFSGFYDIALRDFGLLIAAVALGRLAVRYAPGRPGLRA
jgi:DoxX